MVVVGETAIEHTSPNVNKNAAIGAAGGIFLVCAFVAVRLIMNDTVKTEEDVEKYLKLSVLASVPEKGKGKRGQH